MAGEPRLVGLRGRLSHPCWGLVGIWSVLCGGIASNHLPWNGDGLLTLTMVILLSELGAGSLWDLAAGTDWFQTLGQRRSPIHPAALAALPYTQPGSLAGRLVHWLNQFVGWWRGALWPVVGPAVLGLLAATALTAVLLWLLPDRLSPYGVALTAFVGLGVLWQKGGERSLAGQAGVVVGLGWLAGHLAFVEMSRPSLLLAGFFTVAAWGTLRLEQELRRGSWLLNGGQLAALILLVVLKQPLAAGAVGLLVVGSMATQLSVRLRGTSLPLPAGSAPRPWTPKLCHQTCIWLAATMLVAALAAP